MKHAYHHNQGFTLVELITVLVIIAILSAIVAPSVLGYIDDTRNKGYIANAKLAVTAAQTELTTTYNSGKTVLTGERKQSWKERYSFSSSIGLFVQKGNERAAFRIVKAVYTEGNITVYYDGTDYYVLAPGQTQVLSNPIVMLDPEGDIGDSELISR